jgi:hypothetical protein
MFGSRERLISCGPVSVLSSKLNRGPDKAPETVVVMLDVCEGGQRAAVAAARVQRNCEPREGRRGGSALTRQDLGGKGWNRGCERKLPCERPSQMAKSRIPAL